MNDIHKAIDPEDSLVVDVRTPEEFARGHREGSLNVPLSEIEAGNMEALLTTPKRHLVVVCGSGMRSGRAVPCIQKTFSERSVVKSVVNGGSWQSVR
jgi:rhodanese-related sulfurtransferase